MSESSAAAESEVRVSYLEGTLQELRRVVWPTRQELLRMTAVVIFTVAVIAIFIAGVDTLLNSVTKVLYGAKT